MTHVQCNLAGEVHSVTTDRYQDDSASPEGPMVGRVLQGVRHHAAGNRRPYYHHH